MAYEVFDRKMHGWGRVPSVTFGKTFMRFGGRAMRMLGGNRWVNIMYNKEARKVALTGAREQNADAFRASYSPKKDTCYIACTAFIRDLGVAGKSYHVTKPYDSELLLEFSLVSE